MAYVNNASRSTTLLAAGLVAIFSATLLLATSSRLPLVWDEGDTIDRGQRIGRLAGGAANVEGPIAEHASLRDAANWPFTITREGHPPLAGWLVALSDRYAPLALDRLTRLRLGPILLFAVAIGAMFYRLQRDYQVWAVSFMAVGMLLSMPRVFAHAHFATLDGPLAACWLLAWASFTPAVRDWRWTPTFGAALGLTLAAKFTGWLAPLPFLAWAVLYRDWRALRTLAIGLMVALAIFVALNPPLWDQPLGGLRTFCELNLSRAARREHNITTQFFGRLYDLDHPLPWYNTLVWTLVTVSPMPLLVGIIGLASTLKRWRSDKLSMLVVCQWATLIVVRALPGAPPHDAERLILPSFVFFAALGGIGIGRALYRNTLLEPDKIIAQGWARVLMGIALTAATFDSLTYFPHNLSYYNRLIGGLRGAHTLGLEPTYYWDSLDAAALDWLNKHTPEGERVRFSAAPARNLELLRQWSRLAPEFTTDDQGFRWYVVQRRPSALFPQDRWLVEHETPAYQNTFSGVPLLDVYSFEQFERARAATRPARRSDAPARGTERNNNPDEPR